MLQLEAIRRMVRDLEITFIMWGLTEENLRDNLRWLGLPVAKYKRRRRMTARQRVQWYMHAITYAGGGISYVPRYVYCRVTGQRFVARPVSTKDVHDAFSSSDPTLEETGKEEGAADTGKRTLNKERRFTFTVSKWEAAEKAEEAAELHKQLERSAFEEGDEDEEAGSDEISYFNDSQSVSQTGESLDGSVATPSAVRRSMLSLFMNQAALDRMEDQRERLGMLLERSPQYQMLRSRAVEAKQRLVYAAAPHIERIKQSSAYIAASGEVRRLHAWWLPQVTRAKAEATRMSVIARDKYFLAHEAIARSEALNRGRVEAQKVRRAVVESEAAQRAARFSRASAALGSTAKVHAFRRLDRATAAAKKGLLASPLRRCASAKLGSAGKPMRALTAHRRSAGAKVGATVEGRFERIEDDSSAAAVYRG